LNDKLQFDVHMCWVIHKKNVTDDIVPRTCILKNTGCIIRCFRNVL